MELSQRRGRTTDINKKKVSKSDRAGLLFPVSRIGRYLKKGKYAKRVGSVAPVYLAAVMEYLAAEVLELSAQATKALRKKTIVPRHILLAVKKDSELQKIFKNVTIAQGGVVPKIHQALLPQKVQPPNSCSEP